MSWTPQAELGLPAEADTPEKMLRCALRLQWMIVEKRGRAKPGKAGSPAWRDFQKRVGGPSPMICAMRPLVDPDRLKRGEEGDGPYQTLKAEARADKRWDSDLKGHPLLNPKVMPPVKIDPYQNFDGYDIVPTPLVYTTVNGTELNIVALPANVDEYVHDDFGVDHFAGDFTHLLETRRVATGQPVARGGLCLTANEVDDWYNNTDAAGMYWYGTVGLYLGHRIGGAWGDYSGKFTSTFGVWYYITYDRSGSTITCTIRTTSHSNDPPVDVLTMDDDGTARRYFQGMSSANTGSSNVMSYDVRNVDLQEGIQILRRRIEGY